jgi:hypothetical protein
MRLFQNAPYGISFGTACLPLEKIVFAQFVANKELAIFSKSLFQN